MRLPNAQNPVLGEEKRKLALEWGGQHPYRLQLASEFLFLARVQQHSDDWAKEHFQQQLERVDTIQSKLTSPLRGIEKLGGGAQWIGDCIDDWGNFIKGLMVILVLAGLMTGLMNRTEVSRWFQQNVIEDILGLDSER